MGDARRDLYKQLDALDYHARKITALTTQVRSQLAAMSIPAPSANSTFPCSCGAVFLSARNLALHVQNSHDGPAVPLSEAELRA